MANTKVTPVQLQHIDFKYAQIFIEGANDLVLNKMNARNARSLSKETRDKKVKLKEVANRWEDIITAIHWRDKFVCEDTYNECNEQMLYDLLEHNAPCITTFGLKKSFGESVVRNEIDKYATKLLNAMNVLGNNGLVPITFTEFEAIDKIISPKAGSPVNVVQATFRGWKANFSIVYTDHVYTLDQIVNIINLAGFGLGIGSGRKCGYGRYKVVDVK